MSDTVSTTVAEWLHPLAASTPSPSDSERLIRGLEAHVADEAHDVAACDELAGRTDDPVVRFLLGLIVEDEQHHHTLVRSMISRLRDEADFTRTPGDSIIPKTTGCTPIPNAAEIAPVVRALIRDEHEAARHVRHLARQDPEANAGLNSLLLETIARDSEKHAAILQFVLRYVERSRAGV